MSQSQNRTTLSLSKNSTSSVKTKDNQNKEDSDKRISTKNTSDKSRKNSVSKGAGNNKAKRPFAKDNKGKQGANKGSLNKGSFNKTAFNKNAAQKRRSAEKPQGGLHPRNQHTGRYDFDLLVAALPELKEHLIKNPVGEDTVNFSDPLAVKLLNKALLAHHYGVKHWDIPAGYLCPPIPGRADYIHRVADLLNSDGQGEPYNHASVKALDIGVGANCIYPIIGATEYKWRCTGTDVDPVSVKTANFIAESNANLKGKIRTRLQADSESIFKGVIKDNERYDVTICNPPFHSSLEEAEKGSQRKLDNLAANRAKKAGQSFKPETNKKSVKLDKSTKQEKPTLNFGGQKSELWCPGGEAAFIMKMARESQLFATQVLWFTTLISKKDNIDMVRSELGKLRAKQVKVVEMSQGQKVSRFIAWTFMDDEQRQEWIALK
ncbi:23S rRNA (adenine(1618)-N(6))-methyltransferase RlmF [Vibrio cyclitrophicus]|uniref:Ribosomal RNA large subunit methyltransferase F n=1 Tax=Vibrio cyclitrophicus ZF270 TaxID=1136176 RepID=A0AAN0LXS3_9VIBR|nr:23S rRNA (adenine(1618)-N(6))-methyltransferase RlmF [Vibrio cyclitrophicus]OBS94693.1 23S rRNA (adenine(1618)-N(6))-methyltransferase [Vibrio cyclitrophicus]OBT29360.1 23S rRNA (adenine(1618)-N(6))-methyltransferase [Vibrio cyclitrophicus]OEE06495.1 23S rRNA (adenine(1618)-N(6))-methyltransferase [Vibrio cyclitrophicus ZF270]OEE30034.1 23S rRNA (adenine(1618)-N(6))-methyltransferase [Vibrio cyclitrophicus ZF14]OEE80950.1 23S rRNA (adenine(1618)-N(6))-methyltransferase [Vibrio cyclitrophicu